MTTQQITDQIATLQASLKTAATKPLKDKIRSKIADLKEVLKSSNVPVAKYAKSLLGSQRKVAAMSSAEFKSAIKKLSTKPSYSFLKGMGINKIKDDLKRYAKPVGWRFKGRNNIRKPTASELAAGKRKGTVYYEDRKDRSDVVYPVKLEQGGNIADTFDNLKKGDKIKMHYKDAFVGKGMAELVVKNRTRVGVGKKWESDKITMAQVKNPDGVKFYGYKDTSDGRISFAIGDSAIWDVSITMPDTMAKGGNTNSPLSRAKKKVAGLSDAEIVSEVSNVYHYELMDNDADEQDLYDDMETTRRMLVDHYQEIYEDDVIEPFAKGGKVSKASIGDTVNIQDKNSFFFGKSGVIVDDIDTAWLVQTTDGRGVVSKRKVEVTLSDDEFKEGGNVSKKELLSSAYYEKGGQAFSCPPRKIDDKSLEELTETVISLPQTKSMHVDNNGNYTAERKKLHKKIIDEFKKEVVCITKGQPIAIMMGGSPASGKSSFVRKFRPYLLSNNILKVDADEVRAKLPEYQGCNATQTHLETKDIVNTLISDRNIGIPCDFDLLYDGTMNNVSSYEPLIQMLKERNYKIYIIYIANVPYDTVVERMKQRYVKTGRFVPIEVIDDFFKKGTTALDRLKKQVDGYVIVDGSTYDYNILERGGDMLPQEREYNILGQPIPKEELDRLQYAKGGVIGIGDWVTMKKGTARGKVYEDTGEFVKLQDKYGNKSNTLYKKDHLKHSSEPKYKAGGEIKYYRKEDEYKIGTPSSGVRKELLDRVNYEYLRPYFAGNFGWKTPEKKIADGYLFNLDEFDKNIVKDIKLKQGEKIFRYFNEISAIGGMVLLIKINLDKRMAYFTKPKEYGDETIEFETRGTDLQWLNLKGDMMAKGGVTKKEYVVKLVNYVNERITAFNKATDGGANVIYLSSKEPTTIGEYENLKTYSAQKSGDGVVVSFNAPQRTQVLFSSEVKEPFEDRKSYEKYGGLIYKYEPLTESVAKEILTHIESEKMAKGGVTKKEFVAKKVGKVMSEFKAGKLHSSSGAKVTKRDQAIAIGLSEGRVGWKHKSGESYADGGTTDNLKYLHLFGIWKRDNKGKNPNYVVTLEAPYISPAEAMKRVGYSWFKEGSYQYKMTSANTDEYKKFMKARKSGLNDRDAAKKAKIIFTRD
jgi:predicted ABC-type ATPase